MNRKEHTIGVFIDLSKAFDTVDHCILLEKLTLYGIRGNELSWFQSYLKDRKQYTSVGDTFSSVLTIQCGVPQGSILGPLLFILYVNDMPSAVARLNVIMFADDTNLFISSKDIKSSIQIMNEELNKFTEWFCANKLSLNIDKTKFTPFHKSHEAKNLIHHFGKQKKHGV